MATPRTIQLACFFRWCVLLLLSVAATTSTQSAIASSAYQPKHKDPLNKVCKCPNDNKWELEVLVDVIALEGRAYSYQCHQESIKRCKSMSIGLAAEIEDLDPVTPYYYRNCLKSNDSAAELRDFNVTYEGQCDNTTGYVNATIHVSPARYVLKTPACRTNCYFYIPRLYVYEPGEMRVTGTFNQATLSSSSSSTSFAVKSGTAIDLRSRTSVGTSTLQLSCELSKCAGAPSKFDWKVNGQSISLDEFPGIIRSSTSECAAKIYGDGRDKFVKAVSSPSASIVQMDVNRLPLHPLCGVHSSEARSTFTFQLQCLHYLVINSTLQLAASVAFTVLCPTSVPVLPTTTTLAPITQAIDANDSSSFVQKNLVAICVGGAIIGLVALVMIVVVHRRCCRNDGAADDGSSLKTGRTGDGKPNHKNARVTFAHVEVLDNNSMMGSQALQVEQVYSPYDHPSDTYKHFGNDDYHHNCINNNNNNGNNGYFKVPVITSV